MSKNIDPIATKQMDSIWDEHNSPANQEKKMLEKKRKEKMKSKKRDYGI